VTIRHGQPARARAKSPGTAVNQPDDLTRPMPRQVIG
jgi:hypothetical protein